MPQTGYEKKLTLPIDGAAAILYFNELTMEKYTNRSAINEEKQVSYEKIRQSVKAFGRNGERKTDTIEEKLNAWA